jgi:tripartite-type tricarboxylate transporter receptor subunit TctC
VVDRLAAICKQVTDSPAFAQSAKNLFQVPAYLPAAQFRDRISRTYKVHEALVPGMNLK